MASINAVIVPAKALKGGRHKIRISVAHNGETRYIATNIIIDSAKEFKNGYIVKRPDAAILNTKLRGVLQQYQDNMDKINYINGLTCPELVFLMKHGTQQTHRTLQSVKDEYMENSHIKPATIAYYDGLWKSLTRHIDGNIVLENITCTTIMNLQNHLYKRKLKKSTIHHTLTFAMVLLSYAKKCGYVQYCVEPFANIKLPEFGPRQSWLSVEEIKKIRDVPLRLKSTRQVRDYFMLSYYLGGINMTDLCRINFNEQKDTLKYVRRKTENRSKLNKFVEFRIPDEAKEIINRYKQPDGFLSMSRYNRESSMSCMLGIHIKIIREAAQIPQLIYYSARKSFSQHAFNLGVETSVIDYILGHRVDKSGTSLFSYISVTPEQATNAIRKVLDNLK